MWSVLFLMTIFFPDNWVACKIKTIELFCGHFAHSTSTFKVYYCILPLFIHPHISHICHFHRNREWKNSTIGNISLQFHQHSFLESNLRLTFYKQMWPGKHYSEKYITSWYHTLAVTFRLHKVRSKFVCKTDINKKKWHIKNNKDETYLQQKGHAYWNKLCS